MGDLKTGPVELKLAKDDVLCVEGEQEKSMFKIQKGKLMVCLLKGSQVNPVAYLEAGEFFGELSFFDNEPRSASAIALEETVLSKFPVDVLNDHMPRWMVSLAKNMTKKIRHADELIRARGIKRKNLDSIEPLDMQDQTHYFQLIKAYKKEHNIS